MDESMQFLSIFKRHLMLLLRIQIVHLDVLQSTFLRHLLEYILENNFRFLDLLLLFLFVQVLFKCLIMKNIILILLILFFNKTHLLLLGELLNVNSDVLVLIIILLENHLSIFNIIFHLKILIFDKLF